MVDPAQPPFAGAVPHAPGPAAVEAADEELLPCGGHVRAVPGPADHDERDDEEAPPRASEEFRVGHPCPLSVCGSAHLERLLQRPLRAAGVADDDGDLVAPLRQLALRLDREHAVRARLQRLLEYRLLALLDGDRRAADGAGLAERALHAQLLALAADLAGPQPRVLERDRGCRCGSLPRAFFSLCRCSGGPAPSLFGACPGVSCRRRGGGSPPRGGGCCRRGAEATCTRRSQRHPGTSRSRPPCCPIRSGSG